ncbi:MAG: PHB depolymerase family esterase [Trueperaceae bacterium]
MPGRFAPARARRVSPRVVASAVAVCLAVLFAACEPRVVTTVGGAQITPGTATMRPSPACAAVGTTVLAAPALPDSLVVGGRERTFLARVPDGAGTAPRDLVIAFHGRTNDAAQVRRYFGLDEALPEAIIVYPRALANGPGTFAWSAPSDPPDRLRDFAFVDALVDAVGRTWCVDMDRVFVVGHSLGAYFANDVACRMGDRIRAVASVAGGLQGDGCVGGAAALLVHHPDDRLVRIGAGVEARDAFRLANGLGAMPSVPVEDGPLARLSCARHGDADAADPVVWCARDDATTPRGGYDPHTFPVGAATAIGAFFASLP